MEPNEKDKIELEVRRVLNSGEIKYRDFLQSHFKQLTWAIGIIFTAAGIVFSFLFGNTIDKLEKRIDNQVDAKMLQYSIDKKVRDQLVDQIQASIQNQASSPEVIETIRASVDKVSKEVGADFVDNQLRQTLKNEIDKLNLLNQEAILSRVSLPKGSVISFNRQTCPQGWNEYVPAYGRFIRGIDKSGKRIDPEGLRQPGSTQDDVFKSHSHEISPGRADSSIGGSLLPYLRPTSSGGLSTSTVGGDETRPKNTSLLYCEKN